MEPTADVKVSKLDAGSKKSWKLHQTVDELQKWSSYLQQSAERFIEELGGHNSRLTFLSPSEQKAFKETMDGLLVLKKESSLLKTRSRRLRGKR
jgi:hypothetical protein